MRRPIIKCPTAAPAQRAPFGAVPVYRRFACMTEIEILAGTSSWIMPSRRGTALRSRSLRVGLALRPRPISDRRYSDLGECRRGFLAAGSSGAAVGGAPIIPDLTNLAPEPEAPESEIPQAPEPAEETIP